MEPVRHLLAALVIAVLTACGSGGGDDSTTPPNVILVSVDTLRADHLGCYGYGAPTSPFLDSFAARGVRCERAFAQAFWTLPSHLSLLTSRCHPRMPCPSDAGNLLVGIWRGLGVGDCPGLLYSGIFDKVR